MESAPTSSGFSGKPLPGEPSRQVHIDTVLADLSDWVPGEATWDAVVMVFLHLPPALRAKVHRALWRSLKPGGWFILEAFHPKQLGRSSGGPKQLDMLCTLADVRSDLAAVARPCFFGSLDEGNRILHVDAPFPTGMVDHRRHDINLALDRGACHRFQAAITPGRHSSAGQRCQLQRREGRILQEHIDFD